MRHRRWSHSPGWTRQLGLRSVLLFAACLAAAGCGGGPGRPAPQAPPRLEALATGATTIRLSWYHLESSAQVMGYRVYRDGVFLAALQGTVAQQYVDGGLAHAATHCYTISSTDGIGQEGAQSPATCATTDLFSLALVDGAPLLPMACSVAADAAGHAHVAYVDGSTGEVRYATNTSGTWVVTAVGATAAGYSHTAIAVDGTGAAHVVYPGASIQHVTNTSGSWLAEPIGTGSFAGGLALDRSGALHVGYMGGGSARDVSVASNASGAWVARVVAQGGCCEPGVALALDAGGRVHVAYSDGTGGLDYGTDASGAFLSRHVASTTGNAAIAVDAAAVAHLAFYGEVLVYANSLDPNWTKTILGPAVLGGRHVAIAMDAEGKAHVTGMVRDTAERLYYGTNASGTWKETLIGPAPAHLGNGLVLDAAGHVHVCYAGQDGLRYATTR